MLKLMVLLASASVAVTVVTSAIFSAILRLASSAPPSLVMIGDSSSKSVMVMVNS